MGRWGSALAAVSILTLAYLWIATAGPQAVGAWQDDAIYLATAHSLAGGDGYRLAHVPGEPYQTKYPILYPALLAGVLRLAGDARPALLAPTAAAAALLAVLFAVTARRFLGVSRGASAALAALAALSPAVVSMLRFTMSDLLYAALALSALALLDAYEERAPERRGRLVGAALLMGASVLTRSMGLSVAAGALGFLLWRRRPRDAAWLAAGVAVCALPWFGWQAWAARADAALEAGVLLGSELSYGVWAPSGPGQILRVMFQNVFHVAFGLLHFQWAIVGGEFAARALADPSWRTAVLHAAGFSGLFLVVLGFAHSARRRLRALHCAALAYALAMLAYPGDPYRFLLPWTPFLLAALFGGLGVAVRAAARTAGRDGRRPARAGQAALLRALASLFVAEAVRVASSTDSAFHFRVTPRSPAELAQLAERLRRLTATDDVVASTDFAALWLATGRQGYYVWPLFDPYALFYSGDREAWRFFIGDSPSAARAARRQVESGLVEAYRAGRVAWLVDSARADVVTEAVREFVRAHPEWFEPRYQTPGRAYHLYRVKLPGL